MTIQDQSFQKNFPYGDETYRLLGACFEVYKELGCGLLEDVYQESLEIELKSQNIPFVSQSPLKLSYKGKTLRKTYIPDFICFDHIVVEIKALTKLLEEHKAQVLNYLHASRMPVGLLVNFGHYPQVEHVRFVL